MNFSEKKLKSQRNNQISQAPDMKRELVIKKKYFLKLI